MPRPPAFAQRHALILRAGDDEIVRDDAGVIASDPDFIDAVPADASALHLQEIDVGLAIRIARHEIVAHLQVDCVLVKSAQFRPNDKTDDEASDFRIVAGKAELGAS